VTEPAYEKRETETAQIEQEPSAKIWEHNKLFRTTFHRAGVGMAIVDQQGRYIDSNVAMQKMLGYTAHELASTTFNKVIHPDEVHIASELVQELFAGKHKSYHTDRRYLRKDGQTLWGRLTVCGISEDVCDPEFIIVMVEDITESKRTQSALRDSEERFRLFMDHSPTIVWIKDEKGRYEYISKTAESRYNINANKIIGKTDTGLFPQVANQLGNNDHAVLSSGRAGQFTEEIVEPDGKRSYWLNSKFQFRDSTGKHYVAGIGLDITEQKRNEAALQASEKKFRNIFDNCSDPIFIHDNFGQLLEANEVACRQIGYSRDELLQMTALDIEKPVLAQWVFERNQALEHQDQITFESIYRRKDGSEFPVDVSSRKIEFEQAVCILSVVRDITDRKTAEEALSKSEKRFKTVLESLPGGVFTHDLQGRLVLVNEAAIQNTGYCQNELLNLSMEDIDPNVSKQDRDGLWHSLKSGGSMPFNSEYVRKDGSKYPTEVHLNAIELDGQPIILAIAFDITDRKRSETALQKIREGLERSQKIAHLGSWELDHESQQLTWSDEVFRIFGLQHGEFNPSYETFLDRVHPQDRSIVNAAYIGSLRNGDDIHNIEHRIVRKHTGEIRFVHQKCEHFFNADGRIIYSLGMIHDITERKQVTKALQDSEEKYRLTFNSTPDAVNINRLYDGLFVDINEGFTQIAGYAREEVIGKTSLEVEIWHDPLDRKKLVDSLRTTGVCENLEARFKRKDGSFGVGLMSARTFLLDDVPHIISITRDITYHKQAEAEREKLLSAINQVGESVVITDATGIIEYINPAFEKITGYTKAETIGKNPSLLNSGKQDRAFYQNLWITITGGNTFCGRMINRRKDGTFFTEDTTISPVHDQDGQIVNYVAVKRDITAQLDLEEQYLQAQKMETVGRLAGGIAHDFNNKLGIILGYAELALHETVSQPNRDYLLQIQQATQHSAALTRQLLAFARKQPISPKVLDLNQTVDGMLKMLRRLIGSDINLNWLPGANLWPVRMDPSQIDQIMANLSVNARDAIDGVGKIDIGTQNVSINEDFCATNTGSLPGDYVLLTFSDNGCGMSKEARDHLFEPFYTTKSVGKGTGLGLATIYGIVLQNKGFISVNSKLGKGTIFSIYLPRHLGDNGSHQVQDPHELMLQGNETILLIEDELSLLNLGKQILEKNGYGVLSSSSPIDAIRLAEQYCGKIHLLITDVIMPEMNGREVADRLLMVFPDLQIIFMSGYTAEIIARQGFINQSLNFIQKPYSAKELTAKVREVLDRKSISG
jgi:two-component system, cell cycle sensor histidine kinase and response regulator CckA